MVIFVDFLAYCFSEFELIFFLFFLQITATSTFAKDLDLDSLDTVEVLVAIEEEFNIEIPE